MASAGKGNVIGDWAELLPDLLTSIAKRIHSYEDFVSFGGVCRSWRSVAVKENFNHSSFQIPWLMLAEEGGCSSETRRFSSLTKGGMIHRLDLPEARGRHCISSMGWLITTDEHGNTELLHPISRVRIHLPHPTAYRYYRDGGEMNSDRLLVSRAVLSASPSLTGDYVLMVILGCNRYAAFWKPGDEAWTPVQPHLSVCLDVIYYKDQFYAINRGFDRGGLLLCNPNSGAAQNVGHVCHYATAFDNENAYLVESLEGDLLVVNRERDFYYEDDDDDEETYWTCSFRIYKFDSTDMNKWVEIRDLGGSTIFVGHNAATAVPANAGGGIKPNCIYFTDDYADRYSTTDNLIGGKDMGIYNLQTRTVEPLPKVSTPLNNYCPPIWVFPSF